MVGNGGHRLLSVAVGGTVKVERCTIGTWVLWVMGRDGHTHWVMDIRYPTLPDPNVPSNTQFFMGRAYPGRV